MRLTSSKRPRELFEHAPAVFFAIIRLDGGAGAAARVCIFVEGSLKKTRRGFFFWRGVNCV